MKIYRSFFFFMFLSICLVTNNVLSQNQVTVYLEGGKSISADSYTKSSGKITADGIDYYQRELLFVKEQNKMKIMNFKAGKLRQIKQRFVLDPSNMSDLGKIYAVKYYNTKTDPAEISDYFKTLSQNPEFINSYNDFKKKIKSSGVWVGVGVGLAAVAIIISISMLSNSVKTANAL